MEKSQVHVIGTGVRSMSLYPLVLLIFGCLKRPRTSMTHPPPSERHKRSQSLEVS